LVSDVALHAPEIDEAGGFHSGIILNVRGGDEVDISGRFA
jgi:hypothetical protein